MLACRASRDDHGLSHPRRALHQEPLGGCHDGLRLAHAARLVTGSLGERPRFRTNEVPAPSGERLQVGSRGGVRVHRVVHRGGHEHRASPWAREQQRRQQVVRHAHRGTGEQVRRGGRHDHQIGLLGQADVRERPIPLPEGGQDRAPGERFEGDRPDELGGGGREDDVHRRPALGQSSGEHAALVARDPARHAEDDVPAGQRHQPSWRRRRTSL